MSHPANAIHTRCEPLSAVALKWGTVAVLAAVLAGPATAATKPKPWQWTPQKVEKRLAASSPIVGGDISGDILEAHCVGKGRGVAGRFSRFVCTTRWGNTNGSYRSTLTVRILPRGTGKLCIVTAADGRALPAPGPAIKPERACP